jgi:sugar phosphate isomerase/epimerase
METWSMGTVMSTIRPLEAPDGIDFRTVFSGLREVDYDGTITLHQAFGGVLPPDEAAERSAAFLRSLITAD